MSDQWTPPSPATGLPIKVPNNLVLAIVATVVSFFTCCLPHGLVSLIFALQVDKKAAAGDLPGAETSAKQAKTWAWISLAVAIVWFALSMIFGIFGAILSVIGSR